MQRILPPVLWKKNPTRKNRQYEFPPQKISWKSSILRGEIIYSYPEKTQRTIVSIGFVLFRNLEKVC